MTTGRQPTPTYMGPREVLFVVLLLAIGLASLPDGSSLVRDLISAGDLNAARPIASTVLRQARTPDTRSDALALSAELALLEGKVEEGLALSARSVAETPESLARTVAHARLLEIFGRPKEATTYLERALEAHRRWRAAGRPEPHALLPAGFKLTSAEIPTQATLRDSVEEWFLPHRRHLAALQSWYQRLDQATLTYRELVRDVPRDALAWLKLSRLEGFRHDRQASLFALRRAADLGYDAADLRYRLGRRYRSLASPSQAADQFARSRQNRDVVTTEILRSYVDAGRADAALDAVLTRVPGSNREQVWLELVRLLTEEGRHTQALEQALAARRAFPGSAAVVSELARCQLQVRRFDDAAATFRELLARDPRSIAYAQDAIWALETAGRSREALEMMEALARREPQLMSVRRELGVRFAESGQFRRALPHLEEAYRAHPADDEVCFQLAEALGVSGDPARSAALYRQVLRAYDAPTPATVGPSTTTTAVPAPAERPVARRLLALFKRRAGERSDQNLAHEKLELVANHLGLIVDHRAAEDRLPGDREMARYRGVVIWSATEEVQRAEELISWLVHQRRQGRALVFLDGFGCTVDADTHQPVPSVVFDRLREATGLTSGSHWSDDPAEIRVVSSDPTMCEFERPLAYEAASFEEMRATGPGLRSYLKLQLTGRRDVTADAIVAGPGLGFCLSGYALYVDDDGVREQWRLNPFRFLSVALELEGLPCPDFTTANGARMFFSQVDGDGSDHLCRWAPQLTTAAAFPREVLGRHRLPFTISMIGSMLDPARGASPEQAASARALFASPLVEPAHHSYSHPFDWQSNRPGIAMPDYPKIDLKRELIDSCALVGRYCPPDKPVRMVLWPGMANVGPEAFRMLEEHGLANLNGGEAILDENHPSIANLQPPQRIVGGYVHNLSASVNDFVATDELRSPIVAYRNVLETYRRTERPRLLPVDVYFHFYLLASQAGRVALDEVLSWVEAQSLAPVFASEYVAVLSGFRSARITALGARAFRIESYGACRTVRFDGAGALAVAPSPGVLGFIRDGDTLRVHLDRADRVDLTLTGTPPDRVWLERSTTLVENLAGDDRTFAFSTRGVGRHRFVWRGLPASTSYPVRLEPGRSALPVTTDATGTLRLELELDGPTRVTCSSGRPSGPHIRTVLTDRRLEP